MTFSDILFLILICFLLSTFNFFLFMGSIWVFNLYAGWCDPRWVNGPFTFGYRNIPANPFRKSL